MQHRSILSGSARAERPVELLALRRKLVGVLIPVAVFSAFVNLLGLSGSIYMLQVYDRVLPGYSKETLIVLTGLLVVLYLAMGLLDHLRASLLARAGARIQSLLDPRIFEISVSRPVLAEGRGNTVTAPQDIDALQRLMAGNAPVAVFDAPWLPVHVILLFYIHWLLGLLACGSALVLGGLAVANEFSARAGQDKLRQLTIRTSLTEQALRQDIDTLRALGMRGAARDRWLALRTQVQALQMRLTDAGGGYATASRTFRQLVQSLALGMGAWLAIEGLVSAGTIIACTILLGRALQPVDILIANWPVILRARQAYRNITAVLTENPAAPPMLPLPRPKGKLTLDGVVCVPPGASRPSLRGITLALEPGQALGVIGASASGKTTLAKVATGAWPVTTGLLRLDGATPDQWEADAFGHHIGYLPQEVSLLDGTVAQNISRFRDLGSDGSGEAVVTAAMRAGAHQMILSLPNGYNTPVGSGGAFLSGGQRQRVGLARALFGDPALIVLDEPNSHLDAEGEAALYTAIIDAKARGCSVVVMAHRPSAISACDLLLVLDQGRQAQFGPKDSILRDTVHSIPRAKEAVS